MLKQGRKLRNNCNANKKYLFFRPTHLQTKKK